MTRPELLAAVLADPDLLWAARSEGVCVLSPWERDANSSLRHTGEEPVSCRECGNYVHEVRICRARTKVELWRVVDILPVVRHRAVAHGRPLSRAPFIYETATRDEAEQWCDARLREAGVLLATGAIE